MTVVLINRFGERYEYHYVRMVSTYPDFCVLYFHDDMYPKMEVVEPQSVCVIEEKGGE